MLSFIRNLPFIQAPIVNCNKGALCTLLLIPCKNIDVISGEVCLYNRSTNIVGIQTNNSVISSRLKLPNPTILYFLMVGFWHIPAIIYRNAAPRKQTDCQKNSCQNARVRKDFMGVIVQWHSWDPSYSVGAFIKFVISASRSYYIAKILICRFIKRRYFIWLCH